MDRELNLTLTATETALVKGALIRLRTEEERCIRAVKNSNVVSDVSVYKEDIRDINNILDKIRRGEEQRTL